MIKTFEQYSAYHRIEETVRTAAETLATAVLEEFDWGFLENAVDLEECDNLKVSWMITMVNGDGYISRKEIDDLDDNKFSINAIFQKKKHIRRVDIIDEWVEDNWEDYLDENTVDAINDYLNMGGILGKRQLNGGRFEAFREFQILVSDIAVNKIKEYFKMENIEDAHDDDDDDEEDDD